MRAETVIINELFKKHYKFTGSLIDKQYDDKTHSFLALVQRVLGGTNI